MKNDEFAFFNRQLAAMLREGIPLEGALKQLSAGMRSGPLREQVETLEKDLATGTPLPAALAKRDLPEMYRRMVQAGAAGNDLPGVLTLLADHYERANLPLDSPQGPVGLPGAGRGGVAGAYRRSCRWSSAGSWRT